MNCEACLKTWVEDEVAPICFEDSCLTLEDQLPDEVKRVLSIRSLLILFGELGLAGEICRAYEVSAEDLEMLAFIEVELQKMRPEPAPQ